MKKSKVIIVILLLFVMSEKYLAQNRYGIKQFGDETLELLKKPIHWNYQDFGKLSLAAVAVWGTMFVDKPVKDYVAVFPEYRETITLKAARIYGEPLLSVALSAAFYIHGNSVGNVKNKKLGFEIAQSMIYSGALTGIMKIAIGRARPKISNDPYQFSQFMFSDDYWSLPSGHTTVAFSLSTILAGNTNNKYLKAVIFIPAFGTAISRIVDNYHWLSDVILGGLIGYTIGEYVLSIHDNETELQPNSQNFISFNISF